MKNYFYLLSLCLVSTISYGQIYNAGERSMVSHDSLRNRQIKIEIWYPTLETDSLHTKTTDLPFVLEPTIRDAAFASKKFPLVFLSHGTGGNRFSLAWLAISLAKKGYIAVAPDHWGNTFDNKIPEYFVRYWERPLDISFLLTSLLKNNEINRFIDPEKIAIAGFSFGGYTSLALAGADLDCNLLKQNAGTPEGKKEFYVPEFGDLRNLIGQIGCDNVQKKFKDRRIKAFIAMSPALGLGFSSSEQTKDVDSPVLIFGTENDRIAPIKTNAEYYSKLIKSSSFILLEGKVGHYVFLNEASEGLKKEARKYYTDDSTVDRVAIHKKVENDVISFLNISLNK